MIPDKKLQLLLQNYQDVLLASLPASEACTHTFSDRFERKMRSVLRKAKHPVAYKAFQRAACILLVLLALFGSILAFSPTARATVVKWFREQIGNLVKYSYVEPPAGTPEDTTPTEPKRYELGWLPDGYTLLFSSSSENPKVFIYLDSAGNKIEFGYAYGANSPLFLTGEFELQSMPIGKYTADFYLAKGKSKSSMLVWYDSERDVLFHLSSTGSKEQLVEMAKQIK